MCIRDRVLDTVKILGIRVIPNKTIKGDVEFSIHACRAVSYTHLDVYKRQTLLLLKTSHNP